jgi:hypothetical protein
LGWLRRDMTASWSLTRCQSASNCLPCGPREERGGHASSADACVCALTDADAQRFDAFERKAPALMQDLDNVTAASLGSSGNDCLLNLGRDFQFVLMEIEALKTVVDLEPGMVDTGDDARVLVALRSQAKSFLPGLPFHQVIINGNMDLRLCTSNGAVMAMKIISLYDEAGTLVDAISKKIGR